MTPTEQLAHLGLTLPSPPAPIGNYVPWRLAGNLLFLSGVGPTNPSGFPVLGKVGQALTIDEAYQAAKYCGLALLANMRAAMGSLDRIDGIVKVFGMVNAAPNFIEHPKVINGCTDLFVQVFGNAGRPARSAVGMGSLPGNIAVEIEAVAIVK